MKFIIIILFLGFINCIQQQNEFDDKRLLLSSLNISVGAPKSFGLDMLISNRITRGCETRMGNFAADAYVHRTNATLGFFTSGGIRDDFGIKGIYPTGIIPKGTIPDIDLFKLFLPFEGANLLTLNIRAYRIKQALESGLSRLNNQAERSSNSIDADGTIHGNCWLNPQISGSGRFFQLSSRFQIEVNPTATALVTSGTGAGNSLLVTTEGRRVVRLIIDGLVLYSNSTGDINSGWQAGSSSCVIKGITFTNSSACNFYTLATDKFQYDGSDGNPSLKPTMSEINNDGSVIVIDPGTASNVNDATILFEYIQSFTSRPVFPRISNRILMP